MLREACLRILHLSTLFLKRAAAAGLTLAEIGGMMSRECAGLEEESSDFEVRVLCVLVPFNLHLASKLDPGKVGKAFPITDSFLGELTLLSEPFKWHTWRSGSRLSITSGWQSLYPGDRFGWE
jgi:hypothetical protein